jgi:hypothetical protein
VLRDFASHLDCQRRLERAFRDDGGWARRSILTVAGAGRFSSDRTVQNCAATGLGNRASAASLRVRAKSLEKRRAEAKAAA